jgi:hypothetical protein
VIARYLNDFAQKRTRATVHQSDGASTSKALTITVGVAQARYNDGDFNMPVAWLIGVTIVTGVVTNVIMARRKARRQQARKPKASEFAKQAKPNTVSLLDLLYDLTPFRFITIRGKVRTKYCQKCGLPVPLEAKICSKCGTKQWYFG